MVKNITKKELLQMAEEYLSSVTNEKYAKKLEDMRKIIAKRGERNESM